MKGTTVVAECDGLIVAFGQLHPAGHITLLYCESRYAAQGYGTAIYEHLEQVKLKSGSRILHAEVSRMHDTSLKQMDFMLLTLSVPFATE